MQTHTHTHNPTERTISERVRNEYTAASFCQNHARDKGTDTHPVDKPKGQKTQKRTHRDTHTSDTHSQDKWTSKISKQSGDVFLFLQYLYLFIIFVCTCVCAYECVHHSIGPVGDCLTRPGAAIMKTLLRLPNWHSTPSHWLIGNSSTHTHTHMLMIHAEICWHIQSHTSLHTLCSWCLLCHLSSTCTHGDTHAHVQTLLFSPGTEWGHTQPHKATHLVRPQHCSSCCWRTTHARSGCLAERSASKQPLDLRQLLLKPYSPLYPASGYFCFHKLHF